MQRRETLKLKLLFGLPETCSLLELAVQTPLRDCLWFVGFFITMCDKRRPLEGERGWSTLLCNALTDSLSLNLRYEICLTFSQQCLSRLGLSHSAFTIAAHLFIRSYLHKWAFLVSLKVRILLYFAHANVVRKTNYHTVEPLGTDTSLMRTPPNVPRKFSYILF